tara:strand:+ start:136 stop:336 length:201 start_codon:yes stop_codon:yes gene_type:complete
MEWVGLIAGTITVGVVIIGTHLMVGIHTMDGILGGMENMVEELEIMNHITLVEELPPPEIEEHMLL